MDVYIHKLKFNNTKIRIKYANELKCNFDRKMTK